MRAQAWATTALLVLCLAAQAQVDSSQAPPVFKDAAEEARFHHLTTELRCVQCQNQSLADSNALVARDLRREVLALMREGRSDAQVKSFLVQRYGEFVLYRPRVERSTWLLWFGPLFLFFIAAAVIWRVVQAQATRAKTLPPHAVDFTDSGNEW